MKPPTSSPKKIIVSIPGAGWFIISGNKSSRCYPTINAAKAARKKGAKLNSGLR